MPNQRLACDDDKFLVIGIAAICVVIYLVVLAL